MLRFIWRKNRRQPIKKPFLNSSNEAGELQVIFTIFCLKKIPKKKWKEIEDCKCVKCQENLSSVTKIKISKLPLRFKRFESSKVSQILPYLVVAMWFHLLYGNCFLWHYYNEPGTDQLRCSQICRLSRRC